MKIKATQYSNKIITSFLTRLGPYAVTEDTKTTEPLALKGLEINA